MPKRQVYDRKSVWNQCKQAVYIRQGGICNHCHKKPIEHTHHIIELTEENYQDPLIAYGLDNLEGLCFDCHNAETNPSESIREDVRFNDQGDLVSK